MGNTTIVITKETFNTLNQKKQAWLQSMAEHEHIMVPRITNDQFILGLLDGRITFDKTLK